MNWRTHAIDHLLLVLVCCAWGANCAENSSDRDAGYCDDNASCAVGREHTVIKKPAASNEWKPFVTEGSRSRWYDFGKVLKVYSKWHNRTLYDSSIKCSEKKALVFTPNAGLGDSIGAMTSAFIIAIKQGRMFFLDWKPHKWSVGIKHLPFVYEYKKAKELKDEDGESLLCIPASDWPSSNIQGHVTQGHPASDTAKYPTYNSMQIPYENLLSSLLQPSSKVNTIINRVFPAKPDHRDVALVIRTGLAEYNQFLSPGDENNFVMCFQNYVKAEKRRKPNVARKYRVFLASDNDDIKSEMFKALEELQAEIANVAIEIVALNDSIIHIMHPGSNPNSKEVHNKIRKTLAEFFIISRCKTLFLTHGSLFGRTAAELGGTSENNVHFISDSNCDGKRDKYSYLQCHSPKYPKICGLT